MLSPISALEDSGLPSVAAAGAQGVAGKASPERRREFENILSHALPRFRRIAMRRLRNTEDAEDAVQDAMLSAFRHIARFDGRSQMLTWLTAIVINAVRMQIRRRRRGQMLSLDQTPEEGRSTISDMLADPRPTPEQDLEQRELHQLVTELSGSLPTAQQTALRLRVRDDLSIQETAETLGVPEGTVKAQLARGRAALMERFHKATATPKTQTLGPDSKAKRKASFPGTDLIVRRASHPCQSRFLRNKEETKVGSTRKDHFLDRNPQSEYVLKFLGSRRGGSSVPA